MKVFISGSISIRELNQTVLDILKNIIVKDMEVLIGDADGVDSLVQEYFFQQRYEKVTVFTVNQKCRNNTGNWPSVKVQTGNNFHGREKFKQKDIEMSIRADYGFAIWDGISTGTKENIHRMLGFNKKVKIYLYKEQQVIFPSKIEDLDFPEKTNAAALMQIYLF